MLALCKRACARAHTHTHTRTRTHTCHTLLQAEQKIVNAAGNKEYLPIDGLPEFKKATVDLLLGADHPAIKEVFAFSDDAFSYEMHASYPPRHPT